MFEIRRYTADKASEWNRFLAQSKNGTFLFDRRYMDYHSDRFDDHSLLVYRKNRLFALLPGNRKGNTFFSHQGLTYGGFITDYQATAEYVCDAFSAVNTFLRSEGFMKVVYKPVPWIYQTMPAEEDVYALFVRCHARLIERDVSSTIFMQHRMKFTESRLSGIRKARREGLVVRESDDIGAFWRILTDNLRRKYGAHPVYACQPFVIHHFDVVDEQFVACVAAFGDFVGGEAGQDVGRCAGGGLHHAVLLVVIGELEFVLMPFSVVGILELAESVADFTFLCRGGSVR